ncbi:hypothetical protein E1B28_012142 [Marasmius oreades]|uniref:Uncharacterized protein n=1 Tax=Marasmius oreades TaxID=181124 RepID=A0A9P7RRI2_9AGAR|nr:uncharacterized protein E1B28_012142 [Marasmius oreades]KAG7088117.1 hypothetical protein E1B28_012142 [Marasmius oreades]
MASRFTRLFSSSIRSSRATWQGFKAGAGRRGMSSSAGETKKGSDLPWIIGSAVVFGPAFLYLASPSSRRSAPHIPHDPSHSHAPLPMKDDEGTVADVSGSVAKAEADDVPQADAASHEEKPKDKEEAPAPKNEKKEDSSASMEEKKEAEFAEKKPETGEKGSEYEKTPGSSPDTAAKLQGGRTDSDTVKADQANKEKKENSE